MGAKGDEGRWWRKWWWGEEGEREIEQGGEGESMERNKDRGEEKHNVGEREI